MPAEDTESTPASVLADIYSRVNGIAAGQIATQGKVDAMEGKLDDVCDSIKDLVNPKDGVIGQLRGEMAEQDRRVDRRMRCRDRWMIGIIVATLVALLSSSAAVIVKMGIVN